MVDGSAHVRVPATSANLGPGFDAFGLALGMYDDVGAVRTPHDALDIEIVGWGAETLPRDASHLVVRAMAATFAAQGQPLPGLSLRCENRIPHGKGLGSSAAAVVAGIMLARRLADGAAQCDDAAALDLANAMEGHPDNAAAALYGGLTLAWLEDGNGRHPHAVRLEPATDLIAFALVPEATLATETARGLLPPTVPHDDAAHAAGRSALLVHALTSDLSLLLPATEDRLHQGYRAEAMPDTFDLVGRLREDGLAAMVSGAGPSVLVLGSSALDERAVSRHAGAGWSVLRCSIDRGGAVTDAADAP